MNILTTIEPDDILHTPRRDFFNAAETLATYYWLRLIIYLSAWPDEIELASLIH